MKKIIATVIILVSILTASSQDTIKLKRFIDISISAIGFGGDFVTNSSGVQAGIEFRLKNNLSMQCDLRYIFDIVKIHGYGQLNVNVDDLWGIAINTEIKRYLAQSKNELSGGYVGGQTLLIYTESYQADNKINRTKIGLYATIGWKYIANSGFLFETMAGLGAQVISSYYSLNQSDINSGYNEFPWSKPYESGTYLYPDVSWNVRIGWRF